MESSLPDPLTPYSAGAYWRDRCLFNDGSVFLEEGLWTEATLSELHRAFVGNPLEGTKSFEQKLHEQLRDASPEASRLAAEMLWVMMLFPTAQRVGSERKRELVQMVWSWSGTELPSSHPLLTDALETGIANTGTAYNTQRPLEFEYLLNAMLLLKRGRMEKELRDPWEFAAALESVQGGEKRHLRHLLPHLLFPEWFEPIVAVRQKRRIVDAFQNLQDDFSLATGDTELMEVDRRLHHVRQRLEEKHQRKIHFHRDPEIRAAWDEIFIPDPPLTAVQWSGSTRAFVVSAARLDFFPGTPLDAQLVSLALLFQHFTGPGYLAYAARTALQPANQSAEQFIASLLRRARFQGDLPRPPITEPSVEDAEAARRPEWLRRLLTEAQEVATLAEPERELPTVHTRHLVAALLRRRNPDSLAAALLEMGCSVSGARTAMLREMESRGTESNLDAWRRLLAPDPPRRVRAEHVNDAILPGSIRPEDDRLDVMRDVEALCSVLVASDNAPPISVGLFGNWGTGKSFFMELMHAHVTRLAAASHAAEKDGRPTAFCSHVAQIRFNAWHYMDSNLWASLAARVFEELARHFEKGDDKNAREKLFDKLAESQGVMSELEGERRAAKSRLKEIEGERKRAEESLAPVAPGVMKTAIENFWNQPMVQERLDSVAAEMGWAKGSLQPERVRERLDELRGLRGKISALFASRPIPLLVGVAGTLAAAAGVILIAVRLDWFGLFDSVRAAIGGLLAIGAGWAVAIRPLINKAKKAFAHLETAQKMVEDERQRIVEEHRQEELHAQRELLRLETEEREARTRLADVERQVDDLKAGRRLQRFILERTGTEDYRQHLGVVNLIRNDFEQLSRILTEAAKEREAGHETDLPRLDRIILYIDDLDRCPESRVVEVLQAVHLMLAFPLFVVVVGVDSRWLLLSLEDHFAALRQGSRRNGARTARRDPFLDTTPQNYLEKIFQIPFSLHGMSSGGFGNLIDTLLPAPDGGAATPAETRTAVADSPRGSVQIVPGAKVVGETVGPGEAPGTVEPDAAARTGKTADEVTWEISEGDDPDARDPDEEDGPEAGAGEDTPPDLELNPQALRIEAWERDFIRELHPLIASPRAAKRFTNLYRLLRVRLDGDELARFRGTAARAGTYEIAAVLLACVVGHSQAARDVFHDVHAEGATATWWELLERYQATEATDEPARRRSLLAAQLRSVRPKCRYDWDADTRWVRHWAEVVERYSFQKRGPIRLPGPAPTAAAPGT